MRPRVLLVDDHEIVRKGIRQLLEGPTLEVCGEASNGDEAIQRIQNLKPDIVVMDYFMPGKNGIEVLRAIRKIAPSTKVVILTMDDAAVESAKEAGADACVHKASVVAELHQALTDILLSRQASSGENDQAAEC